MFEGALRETFEIEEASKINKNDLHTMMFKVNLIIENIEDGKPSICDERENLD